MSEFSIVITEGLQLSSRSTEEQLRLNIITSHLAFSKVVGLLNLLGGHTLTFWDRSLK